MQGTCMDGTATRWDSHPSTGILYFPVNRTVISWAGFSCWTVWQLWSRESPGWGQSVSSCWQQCGHSPAQRAGPTRSTSSTSVRGLPSCVCFARSFFSHVMHPESSARGIAFSFLPFNKRILCSFLSLDQHNQTPGSITIDKQSEVYKMLQENQESNEPPRQSASFLVLQEILESEEKGEYLIWAPPLCYSLGWVAFKTLFSI